MKTLFTIICAFAFFACQSAPKDPYAGVMEFRAEVQSDEAGATEFSFEGKPVFLSPPRIYEMQVFESQDQLGIPALGFVPTELKREEFADFTESLKGKHMALLVGGKIVAFPEVHGRLGNGGLIEGRYTRDELRDLIATLRADAK